MSRRRHDKNQRHDGAQMAARAGVAYAAQQFKVQERTVRGWCKEFGLVPAPPSGSSGNGDASASSVDRLSLSGASMVDAIRDPDAALAHVKRVATQCPESSTDPDELEKLALDLRLLSSLLQGHAEGIRYPELARVRAEMGSSTTGERPTVPEMRRKLQWRFGDDTEFIMRRTEYEDHVLDTDEWFWAFQISLPDGRVICNTGDTSEARWRVLKRLVAQWAEATDEEVDRVAVPDGGRAHRGFLEDAEWIWSTQHERDRPQVSV